MSSLRSLLTNFEMILFVTMSAKQNRQPSEGEGKFADLISLNVLISSGTSRASSVFEHRLAFIDM